MPALVNPDQTDFIKSRLLHIFDATTDNKTPMTVLSLDAMKAFDRLEWSYMWSVLEAMGFGNTFIGLIKTLYSNPSAQVLTGQTYSSFFSVFRSSCQGCLLSSALFVLSLEPLTQTIHLSNLISSISIYNSTSCLYMRMMF